MKIRTNRKGFTLIELLVVIAIIAVLAVVVILSLNPAELLRQARDSNRVSDMATLKSAISLYLADVNSPNIASSTATCGITSGYGCIYLSTPVAVGYSVTSTAISGFAYALTNPTSTNGSSSRAVNSTGWIPINFAAISSGAPLGSLPVDPTNSTTTYATVGNGPLIYMYMATTTNLGFKITSRMESTKFSTGGGGDVETGDGGNSVNVYEQGTNVLL